MLSKFSKSRVRTQALREGPAGPLLESFARALSEAGYATVTVRQHLRAAEHFIYWTDRHGMPVGKWNEQTLAGFDRHLNQCHCSPYAYAQKLRVAHGAHLFLTYLRDARIITLPLVEPTVRDPALLFAFFQWMRRQRGTGDVTLYNYSIYIRELLRRLGEKPSHFDARRLRAFVLEKSRSCVRGTAQNCVNALRMFLRFLIAEGQCVAGLDAAIPTLAHWRFASLPRYLPPDDVERLIASCDRASAVGLRDRAILLLLARLGLRAGDIVHLCLNDIDWKGASIQVCGKSRRHTRLPLSQEVGQAIVAYLKRGRPRTNAHTLFIRSRAPFCAFSTPAAVSDIVDRAFRRAGVVRPSRGAAHLLRHSLATSMLRQGTPLEDIAAILRHCSLETTQIYAKVDIPSLRQIAQPWPEVYPC
jgi:integrase/recombinase XerD